MSTDSFSKAFIAAVEEGFSSLGDSSRQTIFFHLETSFNLKKQCIPANIPEFALALERIFGPGAQHLEKLIAKHLHEKLEMPFEEKNCQNLLQCIDKMRRTTFGRK